MYEKITAAHAFVKVTLRLGWRAPLVARKNSFGPAKVCGRCSEVMRIKPAADHPLHPHSANAKKVSSTSGDRLFSGESKNIRWSISRPKDLLLIKFAHRRSFASSPHPFFCFVLFCFVFFARCHCDPSDCATFAVCYFLKILQMRSGT